MKTNKKNRCIWLFGLSGSGKSTLSICIKEMLEKEGLRVVVLDGDQLRMGLNNDLGFSNKDRLENIRRASEMAKILINQNCFVIIAMITPLETMRALSKEILNESLFSVYLSTSLIVCEQRDPKGLYKKVRRGEIANFTGIDAPFEIPKVVDLALSTEDLTINECVSTILSKIHD